jgi:hypothetical protein
MVPCTDDINTGGITGSQGGEYEDDCLLRFCVVGLTVIDE